MKKNSKYGNQKQRVLKWLKEHREITPLESWVELGVYRLSAVICQLRKDGYNISTFDKKVMNRYDETCVVANYRLRRMRCYVCDKVGFKVHWRYRQKLDINEKQKICEHCKENW